LVGTVAGDPEEMSTIDQIFTPGRKNQLLVGSVKSNIGHTESASFLCNLIKVSSGNWGFISKLLCK